MPLNDRDRKALKIGGIVAAVLVLALLGLSQLGKGCGGALPPLSVGPSTGGVPTGPTGVPTTGPSGSVPPSSGGPVPSPIFSGRDPFSLPPQFVSVSPGGTTGGPGPTGTGPGPGPTGTGPGPGPTGTGPGPGPTGSTLPPTNGSATVIGGHSVVLIDTFTDNGVQHASVSVDGTVYRPAEGATFAGGNFELRDVAGNCATFLFGDESFTLCFTPSK
ncbi:MAG: hypothetical protein ABI595_11530 [Actinomycetota bacterium]